MTDRKAEYRANLRTIECVLRVSDALPNTVPHIRYAASTAQAARPNDDLNEITPDQWRDISPGTFVGQFLRWAQDNELLGPWTSADVWFLASEDFGPAHDLRPPPQRVFLGGLKRAQGVKVEKDKRLRDRHGRVKRKATIYTLPQVSLALASRTKDKHEQSTG